MKVVEKFISINGEGRRAGELAVFIRFQGCNLRCSYCDTMWANEADCPYTDESTKEIVNFVLQSQIKKCHPHWRGTSITARDEKFIDGICKASSDPCGD